MGLLSGGTDPDDGEESSPWEGRGFIASAIVVGALVVCALVWFFAGGRGGNTTATQPSVTPATTEPSAQPTGQPTQPPATPGNDPTSTPKLPPPTTGTGGCRTKNPGQQVPRVAPPAVTWQFETDMLIPLQQVGGPALMDSNGLRYCYAHSPTGAVLAAMVTMGQIRNPDLTQAVLERRIAAGPGRTRALGEARATATPRNSDQSAQFTGFKVVDYLPSRAIVSIAVQLDPRSVASLPVTLVWSGGDWKMVLQPDGSLNGDVAPDLLQSLDGYVRFGGA